MSGKFLIYFPSKLREYIASGKPAGRVVKTGIKTGPS